MSEKRDWWGSAAVAFCLLTIITGTCMVFDMGYRAGLKDNRTEITEPADMTVGISVMVLNSTLYNASWYHSSFEADDVHTPTLRNDSCLIYLWLSPRDWDTWPYLQHVNLTAEVLPFEYDVHGLVIERVVIYGHNITPLEHGPEVSYNNAIIKVLNVYDNEYGRFTCTDRVHIVFFCYGSYHSEVPMWISRTLKLTVGPIWTEEATK